MKSRTTSVLVLTAVLHALEFAPSSLAADKAPAIAYSVSNVSLPSRGFETITRGTTQAHVWSSMGRPYQELSSDVWIYHGYRTDLEAANKQGCDTLVITFAQGKVADLKLVNQLAVTAIASNAKFKSAEAYAFKK